MEARQTATTLPFGSAVAAEVMASEIPMQQTKIPVKKIQPVFFLLALDIVFLLSDAINGSYGVTLH